MRPVPRPPASVPLGGSLRASRASQLARPHGPLAAVDLADGRALTVEWLATGWVVTPPGDDTAALPARADPPELGASRPAGRRRRLGTGLALAGALGAAAVALATGLSGEPAPAVAGPTAPQPAARSPAVQVPVARARGGRAVARPPRRALPPPPALPPPVPSPAPAPPAPPAAVAPPAPPAAVAPPAPPPLPELPRAPALSRAPVPD